MVFVKKVGQCHADGCQIHCIAMENKLLFVIIGAIKNFGTHFAISMYGPLQRAFYGYPEKDSREICMFTNFSTKFVLNLSDRPRILSEILSGTPL